VSDAPVPQHGGSDGLGRWLLGGLAAGGIVLGLLIAAYAIGYHRGRDSTHAPTAAPSAATTPTAPTTTTASAPPAGGSVRVTPALVARGKSLYTADGCAACHSLSGSAGAGPSFKGTAGSSIELDDGQTVTADDAYLIRSIVDPDAQIVEGYRPGIMGPAIAGRDLAGDAAAVRALVAFIKSQR
jgi:hypothetical protein